jgi:hypothetical protein
MPIPTLTSEEWRAVRRRAVVRALELTKSKPKAMELADAAIAKALEPETTPWDPAKHKTFADYICDLVWSAHGTEIASYRVTHASFALAEDDDAAAPDSSNPEALALNSRAAARARQRYAALLDLIKDDPLIALLLQASGDEDPEPDEGEESAPPRPNAEPTSTRRALAKGYTLVDIKNARRRLKRFAETVAREYPDDAEVES